MRASMAQSKIKFTKEEEMIVKTAISLARDSMLDPSETLAIRRNKFRKKIDELMDSKVKL